MSLNTGGIFAFIATMLNTTLAYLPRKINFYKPGFSNPALIQTAPICLISIYLSQFVEAYNKMNYNTIFELCVRFWMRYKLIRKPGSRILQDNRLKFTRYVCAPGVE